MFRRGDRLGKYQILRALGEGGFGRVFAARDEIEGRTVALKVLGSGARDSAIYEDFLREVRLVAPLEHPNILPIRNADLIEGICVVASPIGVETLEHRLQRRLAPRTALGFVGQLLEGLAHAHERRVMHCDIKPENLILFPHDRLRIGDFGLAKMSLRTMSASGSGTIGYVAPEQAMGRPSVRSDVFSAGLVCWRMLAGKLPKWPFEWPLPGLDRVRRNWHADVVAFLRRALAVNGRHRFASALQMRDAWRALRPRALKAVAHARRRKRARQRTNGAEHLRTIQHRLFRRAHGRALATRLTCSHCHGPVSEWMGACPWCGRARPKLREASSERATCPRCKRGVKADWRFCAWCWGPAIGPTTERAYPDRRYTGRCPNARCARRECFPWSRYCPWCHTKIKRPWREELPDQCPKCRWGVVRAFWSHCPWCRAGLTRRR